MAGVGGSGGGKMETIVLEQQFKKGEIKERIDIDPYFSPSFTHTFTDSSKRF